MDTLKEVVRKVWGFDSYRPLQAEAMQLALSGKDAVVVLPTGGGKSLCFQAPALVLPGLTVVVSPLISLMHDQVSSLQDLGVSAASINSASSVIERRLVANEVYAGRLKLLYLSPERLMIDRTLEFLKEANVAFFAIDEAHCISDWGHDFRPEFRMLSRLKEIFPTKPIHAFTATATQNVREDIARQLKLQDPTIVVGSFDRPNLIYRVQRREDLLEQAREVIDRHRDASGIVYCIRRADVDEMCGKLNRLGYSALPYHAGLSDVDRKKNQDAFLNDQASIMVATVAFGMGIDKSDVRYVLHGGAPKSLEAYQQESGRAGRDGLEAECWLFHSPGDFAVWRRMLEELPTEAFQIAMQLLNGIENYCTGVGCRHRALVQYFGQDLESTNCQACDICLGELDLMDDALIVSQKILSCVVRLRESFGGDYTAQVLVGSKEQRILSNGHDRLSTYGLLKANGRQTVRTWIEQLIGQQFLRKDPQYQMLQLTATGRQVLKGELTPSLSKAAERKPSESKTVQASWRDVDRSLFEQLRQYRRRRASERGVPPFILFSDATLRDLARKRPQTRTQLLAVHGIGERKAAEYGAEVLEVIQRYLGVNPEPEPPQSVQPPSSNDICKTLDGPDAPAASQSIRTNASAKLQAFSLFEQGAAIEEVATAIGRAPSTTRDYLLEYLAESGIVDVSQWVDDKTFERVRVAIAHVGVEKLKPIFEHLEGSVDYDRIRIVAASLKNQAGDLEPA